MRNVVADEELGQRSGEDSSSRAPSVRVKDDSPSDGVEDPMRGGVATATYYRAIRRWLLAR
jgi:hypothetical protein